MLRFVNYRLLILLGIIVIILLVGYGWALKIEPSFYRQETQPIPRPKDPNLAGDVVDRLSDLANDYASRSEWGATFHQEELNAFFREQLGQDDSLFSSLLRNQKNPRLQLDDDKFTLAFRVGEGFWSTVISVECRVWLVKDQINIFALELLSLKAGAVPSVLLPVSTQKFMDGITEAGRGANLYISWYRRDGNPVAICQWNRQQSAVSGKQLLTMKIENKQIMIGGLTTPYKE